MYSVCSKRVGTMLCSGSSTLLNGGLSFICKYSYMMHKKNVIVIPTLHGSLVKHLVFILSILLFFFSVLLWIFFDPSVNTFQYVCALQYGSSNIYFGIDGISLCLILLTSFFMPLCILSTWNNVHTNTEYLLCLFSIEVLLWLVFSVLHLI